MMREFTYTRPGVERDAIALAAQPCTSVIAGGTELLNWMRLGIAAPAHIVDIQHLPGRADISLVGEALHIGALANLNQVGEHPAVRLHAGTLAESCVAAASAQVRNRATLGGNVLQRTRCAYFRAEEPLPWGCNKRVAGSGCAALTGVNDEHAIFGWTDECVATHPSDPLVALVCLDAEVEIVSAEGLRLIAVSDLHRTQREAAESGENAAQYETTLRSGELITGYRIPVRPGVRSTYLKVRERQSYAYGLVTAAAMVGVDGDDVIQAIHVALGSVAQRPWRLRQAEAALVGRRATEGAVSSAVDADFRDARSLSANGYKLRLARNTAVRAVMTALS